jgi:pyruvate kinase
MRRTKIVATLGPASTSPAVLRALIGAGMDVARLNFSHGDAESHRRSAAAVRKAAAAAGRHVAVLQDIQGPKVRTGSFHQPTVQLTRGRRVTLTARPVTGSADLIPVSHKEVVSALRPRDRVLLADGLIELRVIAVEFPDAQCTVVRGGSLGAGKGVILPGRSLDIPALTPKDLADLQMGRELGFDYVALSFVRGAVDIRACREALAGCGLDTPVIAKLERVEAIRNLDEILACADGVMVARGDLGVEMAFSDVPAAQKDIIDRANRAGVPVITATEMLESMLTSNRPTRAEASDVANAIWDGTDAVMLSQETSTGEHPIEAVRAMARICLAAERHPTYLRPGSVWNEPGSIGGAMAHAAARIATEVGARAIVAFTESGTTARRASKARPAVAVIVASPHVETLRRCALYAGTVPLLVPHGSNTDDIIARATAAALDRKLIKRGNRIVFIAGAPVGTPGATNLVRVDVTT